MAFFYFLLEKNVGDPWGCANGGVVDEDTSFREGKLIAT